MPRQKERQVSEAELEDLRNKFHLLEGDRKAYYEMSMHTMKSNKALILAHTLVFVACQPLTMGSLSLLVSNLTPPPVDKGPPP